MRFPPPGKRANVARQVASDCAALVAEHAKRSELREAHLTAREKAVAAQAEALRVRAARIDGMRAELAAQMTDGSPCPVCGSLDHPDPVDATSFPPVGRDEEDAAFQLASDAAQAADEAGSRVAAVDAVLGDLAQRLAGTAFAFTAVVTGAGDVSAANAPAPGAGAVSAEAASSAAALNAGTLNAEALAAAVRAAAADADEREAEAARLSAAAARLTSLQRELERA